MHRTSQQRPQRAVGNGSPTDETQPLLRDDHGPIAHAEEGEDDALDLYKPLDAGDTVALEAECLTVRAVLVGILLGSSGLGFPASILGAIVGYGILKPLSRLPLPILGAAFGPQENSIVQAAAMGAGGLAGLFVGAVPAMYVLGTLSGSPGGNYFFTLSITLISSSLGIFLAAPLRSFFLLKVARELNLLFPTPTATALTIWSMHTGKAADNAVPTLKAIFASFSVAFCQRIASYFAPGLLYDWHFFTWMYSWSGYRALWALSVESWGWYFEWSAAFFGSGMLIGQNAAISLFGGAVLAWGVIGPLLVHTGECAGVPRSDDADWASYYSYTSLSNIGTETPSPRYWLLWPGVMMMTCSSLIELLLQYKIIWASIRIVASKVTSLFHGLFSKGATPRPDQRCDSDEELESTRQGLSWLWMLGMPLSLGVALLVVQNLFGIGPGITLIACTLATLFSFLSIQVCAVTDQSPIGTTAKATQLIFGNIKQLPTEDALRANLLAGSLVAGCAEVSVSMVSDFRTGFLLGTPPLKQWIAQAIGTLAAAFLAPGVFILFAKAYPCILREEADCPFSAPSASAWAAVARAVNDASVSIPLSSKIFSVTMGAIIVLQALLRQHFLVGRHAWIRGHLPTWSAVSLAFVLPIPSFAVTTVVGSAISWLWRRKESSSWNKFNYAVAAGLIAGEGIAGVVAAVLQIAGLVGERVGTTLGCPANIC